jgi:hypothetical protein
LIKEKEMGVEEAYQVMQDNCGIKVGDKVRVLRKAKSFEMGWDTIWVSFMDEYIGSIGKVLGSLDIHGLKVGFDDGSEYAFPFFVLEKVEKYKTKIRIDGNIDYSTYSEEKDSNYI